MTIMKILELHQGIKKVMKIIIFLTRIQKIINNYRIPLENHENHEKLRIPLEKHENYENNIISFENHENHETLKIL